MSPVARSTDAGNRPDADHGPLGPMGSVPSPIADPTHHADTGRVATSQGTGPTGVGIVSMSPDVRTGRFMVPYVRALSNLDATSANLRVEVRRAARDDPPPQGSNV